MIKVLRDKKHYESLTKQGVMDVLKEYINSQLDLSRRNMLNNEAFNKASWAHYQASEIGQQNALTKLLEFLPD